MDGSDAVGRSGSSAPKYDCLLFDLDDTLYPLSSGLNSACRANIEEFMLHNLHIEESRVATMCLELYQECGTTMAGLKALGYEFDNDEFHAFVHGRLPYDVLKPDPVLRNLLSSMPQRKIIFTNADRVHAGRVLERLGLEDCFEGIICFETLNLHSNGDSNILCKPSLEAFQAAIEMAGAEPAKTVFFDDSVRNMISAKAAGLETVIVGRSDMVEGADHALRSIHNIREALPQLWETKPHLEAEDARSAVDLLIHSAAVETVVLA